MQECVVAGSSNMGGGGERKYWCTKNHNANKKKG